MLICGHYENANGENAFGDPLCVHLRTERESRIDCFKFLTGQGRDVEILCQACVDAREAGEPVDCGAVCESCYRKGFEEGAYLEGWKGTPGRLMREEPMGTDLIRTPFPDVMGKVLDMAPISRSSQPEWLVLDEHRDIYVFNAESGHVEHVIRSTVPAEDDPGTSRRRDLKPRLFASGDGRYGALVNDYGRYGALFDVRLRREVKALDGGDYYPDTVPFSFCFVCIDGRWLAVARSAWNRLDLIDPETGEILSKRESPKYEGEKRPEHYLDYFHGGLYPSPNHEWVLNDGWVWSPFGALTGWDPKQWLTENVWETEDGESMFVVDNSDTWDRPITWIGSDRIAVGPVGYDERYQVPGVSFYSIRRTGPAPQAPKAKGLFQLPGAGGKIFSDGKSLFSSDDDGLSRWDPDDGYCTGFLSGFSPSHSHPGAGELVQVDENVLVRWSWAS